LVFVIFSGFLSRSSLLGTAVAKLAPLETKCTLHDGFDVCLYSIFFEISNWIDV